MNRVRQIENHTKRIRAECDKIRAITEPLPVAEYWNRGGWGRSGHSYTGPTAAGMANTIGHQASDLLTVAKQQEQLGKDRSSERERATARLHKIAKLAGADIGTVARLGSLSDSVRAMYRVNWPKHGSLVQEIDLNSKLERLYHQGARREEFGSIGAEQLAADYWREYTWPKTTRKLPVVSAKTVVSDNYVPPSRYVPRMAYVPYPPVGYAYLESRFSLEPLPTVYGWRTFRIDLDVQRGVRLAGARQYGWPTARLTALCGQDKDAARNHLLAGDCECGIYLLNTPTWHRSGPLAVYAYCVGWGAQVIGTIGARVEHCEILGLAVENNALAENITHMLAHYGVPIMAYEPGDLLENDAAKIAARLHEFGMVERTDNEQHWNDDSDWRIACDSGDVSGSYAGDSPSPDSHA